MYTNNQCGHRDHLGNIREVLDANGAVCQLLLSAKTSSLACTCMHAHASLEK